MELSRNKITCFAPAKINLLLNIGGKFKDNYHLIHSLFCPLTLTDQIEIQLSPEKEIGEINCQFSEKVRDHQEHLIRVDLSAEREIAAICSEKNLALVAAKTFLEHFGLEEWGVSIRIVKNIPFQAGLGGGSADAAAVLSALATRFNKWGEFPRLLQLAASLGADVPAALCRSAVFAYGRGDRLVTLSARRDFLQSCMACGMVIVKPLAGISTAAAYRALGFEPDLPLPLPSARFSEVGPREFTAQTVQRLARLGLKLNGEEMLFDPRGILTLSPQDGSSGVPSFSLAARDITSCFVNDFEKVAAGLSPEVGVVTKVLRDAGVERTLLAGSGSAVAGFTRSPAEAKKVAAVVQEKGETGWFVAEASLQPLLEQYPAELL